MPLQNNGNQEAVYVNHAILILELDPEITVLNMDPVFEWMTGYVKNWKEESFLSVLPEGERTAFAESFHRQCSGNGILEQEYELEDMDGNRRHFLMTGTVIAMSGKKAARTYHVDITGLKQRQKELNTFVLNIPGGVFRFIPGDPGSIQFASEGMFHMIECSREEYEKKHSGRARDFIYTEDLEHVMDKITECRISEETVEFECRLLTARGNIKWVNCRCRMMADEERNQWIYTVVTDVTDLKETLFSLKKEKARLNIIQGLYRDQIFEYNIEYDKLLLIKNTYLGRARDQIISNCKDEVMHHFSILDEDRQRFLDFLNSREAAELEYRFIDSMGNLIWYKAQCDPVRDDKGRLVSLIGCFRDIDAEKRERERLLEQTRRDTLTGLYNKNYAHELIEEYLSGAGKESAHGMLLIDIDSFIRINEKLGHLFGDTVLCNVADRLTELFWPGDIAARVGGDEFLIFVKAACDWDKLRKKALNVIDRIQRTYTGEDEETKITCSIGIAIYPEDGKSFRELFTNAEMTLHRVKRSGKNTIGFYRPAEEGTLVENAELLAPRGPDEGKEKLEKAIDSGFREFNLDAVTFAFDIMSKTKDVGSAIHLLLSKVGRQFRASYVIIFEKLSGEPALMNTYQWYSEGTEGIRRKKYRIELGPADQYLTKYDENGIFLVEDCQAYLRENRGSRFLPEGINIKAMLQCAILEDGEFKGFLTIGDCMSARKWKTSEINSLVTITKLISSYLLKLRLSSKMLTKLENIKNYDDLTGLPTLYKFKKDARALLSRFPNEKFAVICSDISNFKYINDTYGYREGDKILREFARLITEGPMMHKCVSRLVSDNFMALVSCANPEQLKSDVLELNNRFNRQQKKKNLNSNLVVISGVAQVDPGEDIMVAIDNANLARKYSKNASKSVCRFYTPSMKEQLTYEAEIVNSMEEALENGEFKLYLQPKYRLSDDRMVGAEALVRWIRSDGRIISPNDFVPIFEKNGFIVNMDFYIYERVCEFLRRQLDEQRHAIPVSVNVSRVHLNDDKFIHNFVKLTNRYNLPPNLLELELTESIFLDKSKEALAIMKKFRSMGYSVSIDDFGSGYSSLNLLKDIETDVLKLDKEFFRQGDMKKEEKIIVSSIIGMARQLNMKVLSEGVETRNQRNFLKDISCDMAQGFLYAKPMPADEFISRIGR